MAHDYEFFVAAVRCRDGFWREAHKLSEAARCYRASTARRSDPQRVRHSWVGMTSNCGEKHRATDIDAGRENEQTTEVRRHPSITRVIFIVNGWSLCLCQMLTR